VKFSCPKCSTRYTIADDKVPAAATLRFPCKKCGTVIRLKRKANGVDAGKNSDAAPPATADVVAPREAVAPAIRPRASSLDVASTKVASLAELNRLRHEAAGNGGFESEATRVSSRAEINKLLAAQERELNKSGPALEPPAAPDEEWYVLVSGAQKGPMPAERVLAMLAAKEIDKRSYCWKDGMAEWLRLGAVETFKAAAEASGPAAWRVLQPKPAGKNAPSPFDGIENTVAMNANQLADELKRSREEAAVPVSRPIVSVEAMRAAKSPADPTEPELAKLPASNAGHHAAATQELLGLPERQDAAPPVSAFDDDPFARAEAQQAAYDNPPESAAAAAADDIQPSQEVTKSVVKPAVSLPPIDHAESLAAHADVPEAGPNTAGLFPEFAGDPIPAPLPPSDSQPNSPVDKHDAEGFFTPPTGDVDQAYVNAPPGESTRVFMATAGIYKRRRRHQIAAVISVVVAAMLVGIVSLDIMGKIQLPGMGLLYDATGIADPNKDRAIRRVEEKLTDGALNADKRLELEQLRRKLLGLNPTPNPTPRAKGLGPRPASGNPADKGQEGVHEQGAMTNTQRDLATSVFGDASKTETQVNLAAPETVAAPDLPSGLTQETIFKVITENSRSMNLCLTEAMKKGEKLSGKMEIMLTIAPDGTVPEVRIDAPEFKNTQMAQCTVRRIKLWRFPRFNGDPVTVSYPYVLQMGF